MKELLRKNRGKLLLSSLVILLPMILAALAGRTVLFWYPIALLATQWLVVLLVFHDWKNKDQNPKASGAGGVDPAGNLPVFAADVRSGPARR